MATVVEEVSLPSGGRCGCEGGKKKRGCECQSDPEMDSSGDDSGDDESEKELNRYHRQIRETEGFHVDEWPPNTTLWGGIQTWYVEDKVKECTLFAINDYNMKNENANLELVEIVKVHAALVRGLRYYITFVAQDSSGEKRNYQTIVWWGIWEIHVRLFRPEPVTKGDPKKLRLDKKSGEIAP
ncbi:Cystatin domain-containing protein [Cephalotus follicularis]|uniref:Cystatin domain-containing protein n=1 Tax=Cephalotus follicularis TaxID=3775 RepID=A0A1Q3DD96_CEPFO|nr:Cystatin domain-containing protein [Cephalotus follicularis]